MLIDIILAIIPVLIILVLIGVMFKNGKIDNKTILSIVICVIIVVVVLIPIVGNVEPENDYPSELDMRYDDYYPISSVDSVSGAVEIISGNNTDYIHANGIGQGQVILKNGKSISITVSKATLDVFLFVGQSNIAYWEGKSIDGTYYLRSNPAEVTPTVGLGNIYYYGSSNRPFLHTDTNLTAMGIYDMDKVTTDTPKIGGLDYPFASGWAKETGNKCLVINCGWSGSAIQGYIPGGQVYEHIKSGYNDAISKIDQTGFNIVIKGYVFCQGEANTTTSISTYKSWFMQMHDALTGVDDSDFSEYDLPVCYIDLVRTAKGGNSVTAQKELCIENDNVIMGTSIANTFTISNGLLLPDDLHYSQKGQNVIAKKLISTISEE